MILYQFLSWSSLFESFECYIDVSFTIHLVTEVSKALVVFESNAVVEIPYSSIGRAHHWNLKWIKTNQKKLRRKKLFHLIRQPMVTTYIKRFTLRKKNSKINQIQEFILFFSQYYMGWSAIESLRYFVILRNKSYSTDLLTLIVRKRISFRKFPSISFKFPYKTLIWSKFN